MLRFVVLALTVSYAYAGGYGGHGGLIGGAGLGLSGGLVGGAHGCLGGNCGGLGLSNGYGHGYARAVPVGPIDAAIQSTRSYEVIPVALPQELPVPQVIDVGPNIQPVDIIFRTQSSPMNMEQIHTPTVGQFESTKSEDEPSVLNHESFRQVVQNYREVIQPLRNIEQKVLPVTEHVHTVVAKGEGYAAPIVHEAPLLREAPLIHDAPLLHDAPLIHDAPLVRETLPAFPVLPNSRY